MILNSNLASILKMRILSLGIWLGLLTQLCAAQSQMAQLEGDVVDSEGLGLPYATIVIDSINRGSIADSNGHFSIQNLNPGNYSLSISYIGYSVKKLKVNLKNGESKYLKITLLVSTKVANEVTIKGINEAKSIERTAQSVKVIETKEARLQSADLGEVLSRTEGVSIQRSGGLGSNMRLSLNGLSGDQVRYFWDGIPLEYSPFAIGLANIPLGLTRQVEVFKGVLPIQFGSDALGGGVNVRPKTLKKGYTAGLSYQAGSFKTQRVSAYAAWANDNKFIHLIGFHDFSANNYKVDVQVANNLGKLEEVRVRRFHDDYRAKGSIITAGIKGKGWMEELSLSLHASTLNKEVQHNNVMSGAPYGHVAQNRFNYGAIAKWDMSRKGIYRGSSQFGYSHNERQFIDTSAWLFNWFGERVNRKNTASASEIGNNQKSHLILWDNTFFLRSNHQWKIFKKGEISLAIAPTYTKRNGDELFSGTWDVATTQSSLFSWVNSLSFDWKTTRWENNLFVKHYIQKGNAKEPLPAGLGFSLSNNRETAWGIGNVFLYHLNSKTWLKPSYEYAIRLPRADELFGDGAFVADNTELKAERSHNFNLQMAYQNRSWILQVNGFGRIVKNLILFVPNNDRSAVFDNVFEANSLGIEISAEKSFLNERLNLSANNTFQHFYNAAQEGHFRAFYQDRIPNRPFLFANSQAQYNLKNWPWNDSRLSFYTNARYVHGYYLTWESLGNLNSKALIPNQFIQNAGITFQKKIMKQFVALSLDIQNLSNRKVYDFFGVQRPGRAAYLKLSLEL